MKKLLSILPFLLLFVGLASSTTYRTGEKIHIGVPIKEDVYLAGKDIEIDSRIKGDVSSASGQFLLLDTITGDLNVAGGTIRLKGMVGENIRMMGGEVDIEQSIKGDLIMMGGEVTINARDTVYGDLIVMGGKLKLKGHIMGQTDIYGGEVDIQGDLHNDLDLNSSTAMINGVIHGNSKITSENLDIGKEAKFKSKVRYWSADKIDFSPYIAKPATVHYDTSMEPKEEEADVNWNFFLIGAFTYWLLYSFTILIMLIVVNLLFKNFMKNAGYQLEKPLYSVLIGSAYIIGLPVVAALLLITVVGIPFSIALGAVYLASLLFTKVFASVVVTNWFNNKYNLEWSLGAKILISILAFGLIKSISIIPFLGFFLMLVLYCLVFGAIFLALNDRLKSN